MNVKELKAELKKLGLSVQGKKADLEKRLETATAEKVESPTEKQAFLAARDKYRADQVAAIRKKFPR